MLNGESGRETLEASGIDDRPAAAGQRVGGAVVPRVELRHLASVWFQVTGTLCNLACRHCFNASGPRDPWLAPLAPDTVRRAIGEAEALGVGEFYFTGGEPFLHPELLELVAAALSVAPTTVLTNGTLIDDAVADRLAALAAGSPYSLEIRVSLDAPTAEANDRIRGRGSFARALAAIRRLADRGLVPIVTATELGSWNQSSAALHDALRARLLAAGVAKPRIKILPVLPIGRCAGRGGERRLLAADLDGFDPARLQCTTTRVVAAGGVYACPILAGLDAGRVSSGRLTDALGPTALGHAACVTCWETGITCTN